MHPGPHGVGHGMHTRVEILVVSLFLTALPNTHYYNPSIDPPKYYNNARLKMQELKIGSQRV